MARTTHAQTEQKAAKLSSDFGYDYAVRLFGQEAIDSLPKLTRGPGAGKPKGYVCWLKTTTPGYCGYVGGGAPAGMVVRAWIGNGPFSPQGDALTGMWLGRVQTICGSRSLLGEENRKAWMASLNG
jgi:hypothetical protein